MPAGGKTTPGVPGTGTAVSSGAASQVSEKSERAASVMERSRDLGMNMLILVRRFSTKVVVFSMRGAVEMRFSEAMREGIRRPSSWAIMPPMETPET